MRRLRPAGGLWSHSDFLKLWTGQTISEFGSQISQLAIPWVALATLPYAILVDAVSFVVSGGFTLWIRVREDEPEHIVERRSLLSELWEGLGYVLHHRLLLPQAISTGVSNFFTNVSSILIVCAHRLPRRERRDHGLRRGRLQHPAGQPAAGDLPAAPAGPDEPEHALPRLGDDPARVADGGAIAAVAGLRAALFVGAIGGFASILPIALSPSRKFREFPVAEEDPLLRHEAGMVTQVAGR